MNATRRRAQAKKPVEKRRTAVEIDEVKTLVVRAYERWEPPTGVRHNWAQFAKYLQIDRSSLDGYRYGRRTPDGVAFLRILRAGRLLAEETGVPGTVDIDRAQRRLQGVVEEIHSLADELSRAQPP